MKSKIFKLILGLFAIVVLAINAIPAFAESLPCREGCKDCVDNHILNSANCKGKVVYYCSNTTRADDHCCKDDTTACDEPE